MNKYPPSTSSKTRSAPGGHRGTSVKTVGSRQPRAVSGTVTKIKHREDVKTPEPEKTKNKKACSTPTSDEVTISDMTLDASCITSRPGANVQLLDETVNPVPVMKMAPGSSSSFQFRVLPLRTPHPKLLPFHPRWQGYKLHYFDSPWRFTRTADRPAKTKPSPISPFQGYSNIFIQDVDALLNMRNTGQIQKRSIFYW